MSETWNTARIVDLVETYADTHENDDDYMEATIFFDDDYPEVARWVDMPDGTTVTNDEYKEEVLDAQWARADGAALERSWSE
jgi:hypothetical protein